MLSQQIAELFVQFTAKGLDGAREAAASLGKDVSGVGEAGKPSVAMAQALAAALSPASSALASLAQAAPGKAIALGLAAGALAAGQLSEAIAGVGKVVTVAAAAIAAVVAPLAVQLLTLQHQGAAAGSKTAEELAKAKEAAQGLTQSLPAAIQGLLALQQKQVTVEVSSGTSSPTPPAPAKKQEGPFGAAWAAGLAAGQSAASAAAAAIGRAFAAAGSELAALGPLVGRTWAAIRDDAAATGAALLSELGGAGRLVAAAFAAIGASAKRGLGPDLTAVLDGLGVIGVKVAGALGAVPRAFALLGSSSVAAAGLLKTGFLGATGAVGGFVAGLAKVAGLAPLFAPIASALGAVGAAGVAAAAKVASAFASLPGAIKGAFAGLSAAAGGLASAISPITGLLLGMVRGGIAASAAGEVLSMQWQMLSVQVASLFVPQIELLMSSLSRLIGWFQRLDGEQQAQLRKWGLIAAGIMVTGMVLPKVIAAFSALQTVMGGLKLALFALSAHPLVLLATLIAAAALSTMDLKTAMESLAGVGETVAGVLKTAFEGILVIFRLMRDALRAIGIDLRSNKAKARDEAGERPRTGALAGLSAAAASLTSPSERLRAAVTGESREDILAEKRADLPRRKAKVAKQERDYPLLAKWGLYRGERDEIARLEATDPSKKKKPHQDLAPKVGAIEDIEATYRRIAQSSVKITAGGTGKSIEEENRDLLRDIEKHTGKTAGRDDPRPPVRS